MKFASVELKTRGRLGRKPQLDLVIFKSGGGFFFNFLFFLKTEEIFDGLILPILVPFCSHPQ